MYQNFVINNVSKFSWYKIPSAKLIISPGRRAVQLYFKRKNSLKASVLLILGPSEVCDDKREREKDSA